MTTSELLHSLTEAELGFIARLDYGADWERHIAGLRSVVARGGEVRMADEYWYPYEVIELGKNDLKHGHEREFAACLAIVLSNILSAADEMNDASGILERVNANVSALPPTLRDLITSLAEKVRDRGDHGLSEMIQ